jgi:hypothetical protein
VIGSAASIAAGRDILATGPSSIIETRMARTIVVDDLVRQTEDVA